MMMSGLACITPYQPQLETIFEHGKHLLYYMNDGDLIRLLELYLNKEDELKEMGKNVMELASKKWNAKKAVKRILAVKK